MKNLIGSYRSQLRSSFLKNLLTLLSGTTIAQLIPVIISPVLTRLYTPEQFGVLGLFIALVGILSNLSSGRYEMAILLPDKEEDAKKVFLLSIVFSLFMNLLFLLILILFHDYIGTIVNSPGIVKWFYWIPPAVFLFTVYQSFNFLNNRRKAYLNLSKSKVGKSLGTSSLQLGLGFCQAGSTGLIGGYFAGQLIGIGYLWNRSRKYLGQFYSNTDLLALKKEAIRYKKFPLFTSWTNLINKLSIQLPVLFFTRFFTASVVGWYSFAHRILATPVNLIGVSLGQVFYQRATEEKNNPEQFRKFIVKLYNKLLLIAFIPVSINLVFGDHLFGFIFGPEWEIAGQYSQALTIWILFVFINAPLMHLFNLYEKQQQWFKLNSLIFLSRLIALIAAYWYFKEAAYVVLFFGGVSALGQLSQVLYILRFMKINVYRFLLKTGLLLSGATIPLYLLRNFLF
ncbi:MAG: lipopolysaccharide biosynthesis protein [Bacteroidales bacterium]|nr:lipopolysaccharide biosynthesis protein [Bacteroidales bacterium]